MKCHMNYICDVIFKNDENRFPNYLAKIIVDLKIDWFAKWIEFGQKCGLDWSVVEEKIWRQNVKAVLEYIDSEHLSISLTRARSTLTHGYFNQLIYMHGNGYLKLNFDDKEKSAILKSRIGMLNLNDSLWRSENLRNCSLCNLGTIETIDHFIGSCPIFAHYRRLYFESTVLSETDIVEILNGRNWKNLCSYIYKCLEYRRFLIAEFNF